MIDLPTRLRARAGQLAQVRRFFSERGVLEVTTPVLSASGGTDPHIEPFVTAWRGGVVGEKRLYLQTSPEFHMKRLLAAGSGDIYQVTPAFRQGEYGNRHNPEFSLLEWYRLGFDHHRLMDEVAELVNVLLGQSLQVEKIAYRDLFLQRFGWDPLDVEPEVLRATAEREGLDAVGLADRDQWLDLLMSLLIEPQLGRGRLTFVYDYPASQASLARLKPGNLRLACRFELYHEGVELANGFHELTDPGEQRERFLADNQARKEKGLAELPLDERLLSALEQGLPDCAGVALGLDRLLMLKLGAATLSEVLSFSLPEA